MTVYIYKCKLTGDFLESAKRDDTQKCPADGSELEYVGELPE